MTGAEILLENANLELREMRATIERLREALRPFARVAIPHNWPGDCVLAWHDRWAELGQTKHSAFISYLHVEAQGGPTIEDYRKARAALEAPDS